MNAIDLGLQRLSKERAITCERMAEIETNEAFLRTFGRFDLADVAAACLEQTREILNLIDRLTMDDGQQSLSDAPLN